MLVFLLQELDPDRQHESANNDNDEKEKEVSSQQQLVYFKTCSIVFDFLI